MAYFRIGATHLLQSRTKEAIVWLERARAALPESPNFRAMLASAYALEGTIGAATAELAVARILYREGRLESIARVKAAGLHAVPGYFGVPKVRALFETTYFEGLRKSGLGYRRNDSPSSAAADFWDQVDFAFRLQRGEVGVLEDLAVDRHRHAFVDLVPRPRPVYGENGAPPRRDGIRFNCRPSSIVSMRPSQ